VRFLRITHGSLTKIKTQVSIAHRLGYIGGDEKAAILKETTAEQKRVLAFVRSVDPRSQ
jgi:hypothetical protein